MTQFHQASEKAPEGTKLCGCCFEYKPFSEFFRDGYDSKGNVRHRRDCKECYKTTRKEAKALKMRTGKMSPVDRVNMTKPAINYGMSKSKADMDKPKPVKTKTRSVRNKRKRKPKNAT